MRWCEICEREHEEGTHDRMAWFGYCFANVIRRTQEEESDDG